jgi:hypothetical protein
VSGGDVCCQWGLMRMLVTCWGFCDYGEFTGRSRANDLVGLEEEDWGDGQAEGLHGLEVDHQFKCRGLLYPEVRGFCAFRDAMHDVSGSARYPEHAGLRGHQPSGVDKPSLSLEVIRPQCADASTTLIFKQRAGTRALSFAFDVSTNSAV